MRWCFCLGVLVLALGCGRAGRLSVADAEKQGRLVKIGASRDDVKKVFGEPDRVQQQNYDLWVWDYPREGKTLIIAFNPKGVHSVSMGEGFILHPLVREPKPGSTSQPAPTSP